MSHHPYSGTLFQSTTSTQSSIRGACNNHSLSDAFLEKQVSLSANLTCGTVVRALRNDLFDQPSTTVRKGSSLYAVMFKLDTPDEDVPTTPYESVRVDRDGDAEDVCTA